MIHHLPHTSCSREDDHRMPSNTPSNTPRNMPRNMPSNTPSYKREPRKRLPREVLYARPLSKHFMGILPKTEQVRALLMHGGICMWSNCWGCKEIRKAVARRRVRRARAWDAWRRARVKLRVVLALMRVRL